MTISSFIESLSSYTAPLTFNPWNDFDPSYEVENSIEIRRKHLTSYLEKRVGKAKYLFIAEACGYQGGHFSGIAMTCERMILNYHPSVTSEMILGYQGRRTSKPESPLITKSTQKEKGFNEPTDSVVWKAALEQGLSPDEFLLWNIFPFHPYKEGNLLSNRTPTDEELAIGLSYTKELLEIVGNLPILAIGKKSETTLQEAGLSAFGLRHPANGGANIFRNQLHEFLHI